MAKRGVPLDGILLLNKPLAMSANTALQRAKRLYQCPKSRAYGQFRSLCQRDVADLFW